ncbi:MAG: glycosyltransferase family 4 protein [Actinomycetota bacterium]
MNLVVVTPHFAPDVAPTGDVVTRITEELADRNHRIDVVTSLPWYREHKIEPGFEGRLIRYEDMPWGRIARVHPFPTVDKRNIARRAAAFAGFSILAAFAGSRGGPVDGVLALSPPLTLGLAGWKIARARRGAFVFNIQDVYPDVAVELGMLNNRLLIAGASRLERFCYRRADLITVLSEDLKENIARRISDPSKIRVVPNFVDTQWIRPAPRSNAYRRELGLNDEFVVMYAGNVGLSQSLDLMIEAATALAHDKDIVFVINGQGARRAELEVRAASLPNVRFADMQPPARLPEVLSAADVHVVPLRRGLARSSVPSKTYSILAAARPIIASVDGGSEVARVVEAAGAGIAVPPEDPEAFTKAVRALAEAPEGARRMGRSGRSWVESWASPQAVAAAYEELFTELAEARDPRSPSR